MEREFATHCNRIGVIPPSRAEMALARSRGFNSITGEQLRSMRAEASATKRSIAAAPVVTKLTQGGTVPAESLT
jgi:hypothetical protein